MRFLAIPTNNFEDYEGDIISKDAHLYLRKLIKEKIVNFPPLVLNHNMNDIIGITDYIDFKKNYLVYSGICDYDKFLHLYYKHYNNKYNGHVIQMSHQFYSINNEKFVHENKKEYNITNVYLPIEISILFGKKPCNKFGVFKFIKE